MSEPPAPQQPNTLGNTSLILGIASAALVFSIGLCALTGVNQRWIQLAGTPLFVCGGTSAFLGFLAALLGVAGLFGRNRSRATAIVGLVLGIIGACLFFIILNVIGRLR
jgi:riboflavin transporter FmnP